MTTLAIAHEDRPSPPWIGIAEDGLDQVLVAEAARRCDVPIAFVPLPWERCFQAAAAGEVDAVLSASYRLRRLDAVAYPLRPDRQPDTNRCLHRDSYAIYRRIGEQLGPDERVAAQRGFAVVEILSDLGIPVDDRTDDPGAILAALAAGHIAAAALLCEVADRMIAGSPAWRTRLVRDPLLLPAKPYYLAFAVGFHRQAPHICTALWDAIAAVRTSAAWRERVSR